MATYSKAPASVDVVIQSVIDEFYPDLVETRARIGAIFAYPDLDESGEEKKPPLMKNGLRILARIKKNSEADRVDGKPDATITVDASYWKTIAEEPNGTAQQRALIDHELNHLICKREKVEAGFKAPFKTDPKSSPRRSTPGRSWMPRRNWSMAGFWDRTSQPRSPGRVAAPRRPKRSSR